MTKMSWKVCCGAKEGGKNVCSSKFLPGDGEEITRNRRCTGVCVCLCVMGQERLGKIRNKKEEGGCWGPCTPLGLPCMLIRNTRFLPPEFIITGADSLGWPEALHQHTYPTGCQHVSNLFFSSLSLSFNVSFNSQMTLSTTGPTVSESWAHPRAAWHHPLCPAAWLTDLGLSCSLVHVRRGEMFHSDL